MIDVDALGDRMKEYESVNTRERGKVGQPIMIRLDGKAFHTFTRGLKRPFDSGLTDLMIATTEHLVKSFNANLGYTQSDEITLMLYIPDNSRSEYIYGGRFQKLNSLCAASASVFFNKNLPTFLPSKADCNPIFDARSFSVPSIEEAYMCFLWRQLDAKKNAISMAAHSLFSHKTLQGIGSKEKIKKMSDEMGIDFNNYPASFRRGTFVAPNQKMVVLSEEQLLKIPEKYRDDANMCVRTVFEKFDWDIECNPSNDDIVDFYHIINR